jgi:hypothetical protein
VFGCRRRPCPGLKAAAPAAIKILLGPTDNQYSLLSCRRTFEKGVRMLPRRPDVASLLLLLMFSAGLATLSRAAGFSIVAAAIVGAATATVGWWASATEP